MQCPLTTFECLGQTLAWALTIERVLVVIIYFIVTRRWIQAAGKATGRSRRTWLAMAWVFRLCAVCGYGLPALAGWNPMLAYWGDVVLIPVLLGACVLFLTWSRGMVFMADKSDVLLGQALSGNMPPSVAENIKTLSEARDVLRKLMK